MGIVYNKKLQLAEEKFADLAYYLSEKYGDDAGINVPVVLFGSGALITHGVIDPNGFGDGVFDRDAGPGPDLDIYIPGEIISQNEVEAFLNSDSGKTDLYKELEASLENPEDSLIEVCPSRDLNTDVDFGDFEKETDPLIQIEIGSNTFSLKTPSMATMALAKSFSYREKDRRDALNIVSHIGVESLMSEANRLIPAHGEELIANHIKDVLSEIATEFMLNEVGDYQETFQIALNELAISDDLKSEIEDSFGITGNDLESGVDARDMWPESSRFVNNDLSSREHMGL